MENIGQKIITALEKEGKGTRMSMIEYNQRCDHQPKTIISDDKNLRSEGNRNTPIFKKITMEKTASLKRPRIQFKYLCLVCAVALGLLFTYCYVRLNRYEPTNSIGVVFDKWKGQTFVPSQNKYF